jgi:imidazole glycerol-phosphate synthase subunit HisH
VTRTAVIDNGLCNLDSIARAIEECGGDPFVTSDPSALRQASKIVLPGVGAFAGAMNNLHGNGMAEALSRYVVEQDVPFLGICLGMHLMARGGEEGSGVEGLGWIDAQVVKMKPRSPAERIPHVGWNEVTAIDDMPLFDGIRPGADFYFVHSYQFQCADASVIAGTTPYCGGFASVVAVRNILGVQFHPEKSQKPGFRLLQNFLAL